MIEDIENELFGPDCMSYGNRKKRNEILCLLSEMPTHVAVKIIATAAQSVADRLSAEWDVTNGIDR